MLQALPSPHPALHCWAGRLASSQREAARVALRQQCAQALQARYGGSGQASDISNTRGQAPQWLPALPAAQPRPALALSFSYEGQYAAFAWYEGRALGIDLFALNLTDWQAQPQHWRQVTHDYLGAAQAKRIFALAAAQQAAAFAQAWSRHEAALKCLQSPLQEWQPALQAQITQLQTGLFPLLPWQAGDAQHCWALAWALPPLASF